MAIINSYPLGNINRKSKLLGTESPGQETSNFTMSSIEDFITRSLKATVKYRLDYAVRLYYF